MSGRWTGKTDLPLTEAGERQVTSSAKVLIGPGKLLEPAKIARIYVSPRLRAQQTFGLMFPRGETLKVAIVHTDDVLA